MLATIGVFAFFLYKALIPGYLMFPGLIASLLVAWVYWSFAITRWRIWAFSQVEDVHELKARAISGMLIWPDGSFFEKTEVRTKRDRELLRAIEVRFEEDRLSKQITDDPTIPDTTLIYYSRRYISLVAAVMALIAAYGVYAVAVNARKFIGLFCVFMGGYYILRNIGKVTNKEPQIVLDKVGITIGGRFSKWTDVTNISVSHVSYGRLIVDSVNGSESVDLSEYDITSGALEKAIDVYILRSRQSQMQKEVQ